MPTRVCTRKGADYGNISTSAKRFKWHQNEGSVESDQKTDYLFQRSCHCGGSTVFSYQRCDRNTGSSFYYGRSHVAIFLFGNVYEGWVPGGKDFVFYDTAEISDTGNQTL